MAALAGPTRDLVSYTNRQVTNALTVGVQNAFRRSMREVGEEMPRVMRDLGRALDLRAIPPRTLEDTNMTIARNAQQAMVAGYKSRLPRRSAPYRSGERLTGALGAALADPSMLRATTASTISFLNGTTLGNQAEHWYRVNYGAMGPNLSQGRSAEDFPVTINGTRIAVLRDQARPAPQSWLPRRFVLLNAGVVGQEMFIPLRGPADVRGRGVRAAYFTDIGLDVVAEQFGPLYYQMFVKYLHSAAGQARLQKYNITVDANIGRVGR